MTEVKTIGDYINALPNKIRKEVRRLNTPENSGTKESSSIKTETLALPCLFERPLNWIFIWEVGNESKWLSLSKKYTLTKKDGKYYTNW